VAGKWHSNGHPATLGSVLRGSSPRLGIPLSESLAVALSNGGVNSRCALLHATLSLIVFRLLHGIG